ncbi:MAG: DUF190 domain-containing protein [Proteobacteria bacterium]|nr:DUF190 domain-containing protein [Pseudomonadota bacterium]
MNPTCALRFYLSESRKQHGRVLYEWLLEDARHNGVHGGSAFRAIAGYGRHGILHEQHFFELAGELTVVVEFLLDEAQAEAMLERLRGEGIDLFYARFPIQTGTLGGGA